jgi:tetratricopeptide (TPR) repeat protein
MRAVAFTLSMALSLGACATTKSSKAEELIANMDVRAAELTEKQIFDALAVHELADSQYTNGNFIAAHSAYRSVLMQGPKDYDNRLAALLGYAESALALSGEAPHYLDNAEEALAAIAMAEDLTDEAADKLLAGQVLLEIAKLECNDIEVRLNEALEQNLDDPRLWNALGHYHDSKNEWLIALETYVKAMKSATDGEHPVAPVINNMGMSLLMQGRSQEALAKFEQAHKINGNIRIYDNNRRLALILSGHVDRALGDLDDKRAAQIYNDAGYVSAANDRTDAARFYYEKAIASSPTYFETAEQNLAVLLKKADEKAL